MSLNRDHRNTLTDLISPDVGQFFDMGVMLTYSLDLEVLMMLLLSLTSKPLESDNSKSLVSIQDQLSSIRRLTSRFQVICHPGKTNLPKNYSQITPLLDNIIKEATLESTKNDVGSFHPKMSLLKYKTASGEVSYRLIVSSKNLTTNSDLDTVVKVDLKTNARKTSFGNKLSEYISRISKQKNQDWNNFLSEIKYLDTKQGTNNDLVELLMLAPSTDKFSLFDHDSKEVKERIIISPFLNSGFLKEYPFSPAKKTYLVTRRQTFDDLCSSQRNVDVLNEHFKDQCYQCPPSWAENTEHSFGLHAKIIADLTDSGCRIITGSSNFTTRGWSNINWEVNAVINYPESTYYELKNEFIGNTTAESSKSDIQPLSEKRSISLLDAKFDQKQKLKEYFEDVFAKASLDAVCAAQGNFVNVEITIKLPQIEKPCVIYYNANLVQSEMHPLKLDKNFKAVTTYKCPLDRLSRFIEFSVHDENGHICSIVRMIPISDEILALRDDEILFSVINNETAFFKYLASLQDIEIEDIPRSRPSKGQENSISVLPIYFSHWDGIIKACIKDPQVAQEIDSLIYKAKIEKIKKAELRQAISSLREVWADLRQEFNLEEA